ncbi:acetyltransferase [Streptomyces actinomycinicus]|uniref:Lysine N-acyltransferase MbtK n=1 Tax=Streptomyces actinomycinicus TaxID=1695166 RepID=A0A937EMF6_9ACTN|nr:GNAT family N-acetyltransferase [Streptomyces actinomycinicus]MBL1085133.1 acetyltransferase [Streptomyces actinomycinicus]
MPPTDASAGTGPAPAQPGPTGPRADVTGPRTSRFRGFTVEDDDPDSEDTLELRLPTEFVALPAGSTADLLDRIPSWGPVMTSVGAFRLAPVRIEQDLPLLQRWMNDPVVAEFWELAGPRHRTADHLRAQLGGGGRSVPCLGVLDGRPMSYWEIYRADLDPLARHYSARPHDTGIHVLLGDAADRGRGVGSALLRAVADLILDRRPACTRVVAEPALGNTPSVSAFLSAGFRFAAEIDLPGKRAALMIRDRSLRQLL